MSQMLFLIRLRKALRVRVTYSTRVDRTRPLATFSEKRLAEAYTASNFPTAFNPFSRDLELASIDLETRKIVFAEYEDSSPVYWECEWLDFVDKIDEVSVEVPHEGWKPDVWELWWDTVTESMTASQREYLRIQLGLPPWGENPFKMSEIWIHDKILLHYAVPLKMIEEMLTDWGLTPPEMVSPGYFAENVNRWVSWWDENAPRMTDEQKTALWRLLDLQPYEIVEVPLEGRR